MKVTNAFNKFCYTVNKLSAELVKTSYYKENAPTGTEAERGTIKKGIDEIKARLKDFESLIK